MVNFSKLLLGKSKSFDDFGTPQAFGALSLLVAWIIVGLCIIRGVKSSGKVCFIFFKYFLYGLFSLGSLFYCDFPLHSTSYIDYSKCNIRWSDRWS